MSDHTPGPWQVSELKRGVLGQSSERMTTSLEVRSDFHSAGTIKNGPEATICEISLIPQTAVDCGGSGFCHVTDPKANARLVAAAPDLLDSNTKAPDLPNDWASPEAVNAFTIVYRDWLAVRDAAIAKATTPQ